MTTIPWTAGTRLGPFIWRRAWYQLICSEVDAAAGRYEKIIEARDLFAVVYANSPYTKELRASAHWPRLSK